MDAPQAAGESPAPVAVTRLRVLIGLSDAERRYLESCARVRGLSTVELLRRIVRVVLDDQMILSVLDDDAARVHDAYRYIKPDPSPLFDGLAPNVQHMTTVERARTRA